MSKIDDAGVLVVGGCDAGRGAGMDQVYCTQGAFDRSDLLAEDAGGEGKIEECSESWSLVLNLSFVDDFGVFAEDLDAVQSDDEVMVALAKVVDTFGKGFSGSPAVIGSRIATDRHRTTSYHVWLPVTVVAEGPVSLKDGVAEGLVRLVKAGVEGSVEGSVDNSVDGSDGGEVAGEHAEVVFMAQSW
ncbi:unnamed protein product [Zymoseptoria tritici ST99CH_1A5]|uniref:Uncharacterized protein n=1 Tax=Zymoseptoria tritici ST99CH_1A5 TaxID=1276529 RepID=A0A1Y6M1Q9_ZYMTR|nr:unnamed protein product [Zymoseptoria tritici ST99CH_1A5]